jgi:hypothetical protein
MNARAPVPAILNGRGKRSPLAGFTLCPDPSIACTARLSAQAECARHTMGLQDRDAEESLATEVCVCAVDARDGGQTDQA